MSYWAAARLQPHRERLALHFLKLNGFESYTPPVRERRVIRGHKMQVGVPLFLGYTFISIELQWHAARWCPGILGLVMDGDRPARVPDAEIAGLRSREHNGFVVLLRRPKPNAGFNHGDRLRVRSGPLTGHYGLYTGMASRDRIMMLLRVLGAARQVELAKSDVMQIN